MRLLSGYEHFPILLLQNPARSHHQDYEEMIECPTFQWVSKTLETIGLSMDDTPILDMCSFFSDEDLAKMDDEKKLEAIQASYALAEDILSFIRPKAVVSCQCATKGVSKDNRVVWPVAQSQLVEDLCSSTSRAKDMEATKVVHGALEFWCFWGFHPRWHKFGEDKAKEQVLTRLFHDVYMPCSIWEQNVHPELLIVELKLVMEDMAKVMDKYQAMIELETNKFKQFVDEMCGRIDSTRL